MQRWWYQRLLGKEIAQLSSARLDGPRARLLSVLEALLGCCNHPRLFRGAPSGESGVLGALLAAPGLRDELGALRAADLPPPRKPPKSAAKIAGGGGSARA